MSDEEEYPNNSLPALEDMLIDDDSEDDDDEPDSQVSIAQPSPRYAMPTATPVTKSDIAASVAAAAAEANAEIERAGAIQRRPGGGRPRINPDMTQRELGRVKTEEKRKHLNSEADIAFSVLLSSPGFRESLIGQLRQAVDQRLYDQTEHLSEGECYDLEKRAYVKAFTSILDDIKCREVLERLQAGYGGHTGQ